MRSLQNKPPINTDLKVKLWCSVQLINFAE